MLHRKSLIPAIAALVLTACGSMSREGLRPVSERKAAPDFSLKDAYGRSVHLSDYKGKVVLLNFWASWCGPCRIEIPWFADFESRYKEQGFAVVGVSMDDGWEQVKPFLEQSEINYRVLLGDRLVADQYGGIESLPSTFIIDREGRIASIHLGLVSRSNYEDDLHELFKTGPVDRSSAGQ